MSLHRRLAMAFLTDYPAAAALELERMPPARRAALVRTAPAQAAPALGRMVSSAAAAALAGLNPEEAAPALNRLPLDAAVRLLRHLPGGEAEPLIDGLPEAKQEALRRALRYPQGTAGALMNPAVLVLPLDITVAEARLRIRRQPGSSSSYLYVVDREGRLAGAVDVSGLTRGGAREQLQRVMRAPVEHLAAWLPSAAVRTHPGWQSFHALPVVDEQGRLVGEIPYRTMRSLEREAEEGRGRGDAVAAGALGELLHVGVAGLFEAVMAAAAARASSADLSPADGRRS